MARPASAPLINETQWLRGHDAIKLLAGLPMTLGPRKQRLFACACCRRNWDRLDERCRSAVALAEQLADAPLDPLLVRGTSSAAGTVACTLMSQGDLEAGAARQS